MEKLLNWVGRKFVSLAARLMFAMDVVEHAELPPGPKIIAANHPSTTDPFVVLGYVRKKASVLIKDVLFNVPVFGPYLHAAGHICVRAEDRQAVLAEATRTLERGETIIIFPEGTISPLDGGFHRPRTGVSRLALTTGVPVIPVGIGLDRRRIRLITTRVKGQEEVGTWYLGGPYAITMGRAIQVRGDAGDRQYVAHVTEMIMARIAELARESYQRISTRLIQAPESAAG